MRQQKLGIGMGEEELARIEVEDALAASPDERMAALIKKGEPRGSPFHHSLSES